MIVEPVSRLPWKAGCSAQQRPLPHQVLTTWEECPVAADDRRLPLVVVHYYFRFPGLCRLRGCWPQRQKADQAVSDSLLPPSHPHKPTMTGRLILVTKCVPGRQRPKTHGLTGLRISPWLQAGLELELCRSGTCRRGTCRQGTCQLGRSGQPAEDAGGPQRPPFPQKPRKQSQRSRISTWKSPAV